MPWGFMVKLRQKQFWLKNILNPSALVSFKIGRLKFLCEHCVYCLGIGKGSAGQEGEEADAPGHNWKVILKLVSIVSALRSNRL